MSYKSQKPVTYVGQAPTVPHTPASEREQVQRAVPSHVKHNYFKMEKVFEIINLCFIRQSVFFSVSLYLSTPGSDRFPSPNSDAGNLLFFFSNHPVQRNSLFSILCLTSSKMVTSDPRTCTLPPHQGDSDDKHL